MLIHSMSVSVDGFIADREGAFGWADPTRSCFVSTSRSYASSVASVRRRLYETMLMWETDPSLRENEGAGDTFSAIATDSARLRHLRSRTHSPPGVLASVTCPRR